MISAPDIVTVRLDVSVEAGPACDASGDVGGSITPFGADANVDAAKSGSCIEIAGVSSHNYKCPEGWTCTGSSCVEFWPCEKIACGSIFCANDVVVPNPGSGPCYAPDTCRTGRGGGALPPPDLPSV